MAIQNNSILQTRDAYNKTAQTYSNLALHLHPKTCADLFLKSIPPEGTILDIGCGSGRDAKIFSEVGYKITGIDFSSEMIKIAKEAAPKATFIEADIQELNFPSQSFNGIWANASLLHIQKNNLKSVLLKIHSLLKDDGIFYMSVKKGNSEYFGHDKRYTENKVYKFWSFYEPDEIADILKENGFDVKKIDITTTQPIFIRIHSRKV
jgi:ubiquinone/menaquinone biosynthesis C-methylase UbiE